MLNQNVLFLNCQNGKCTTQVVGKNKFGKMPEQIAQYLGLPNRKEYTGHSFRRTSATLLANAGANITTLKRHGGWKSDKIAEGYIEESLNNKIDINNQITRTMHLKSSTATNDSERIPSRKRMKNGCIGNEDTPTKSNDEDITQIEEISKDILIPKEGCNIRFTNCSITNSNINIHVYKQNDDQEDPPMFE